MEGVELRFPADWASLEEEEVGHGRAPGVDIVGVGCVVVAIDAGARHLSREVVDQASVESAFEVAEHAHWWRRPGLLMNLESLLMAKERSSRVHLERYKSGATTDLYNYLYKWVAGLKLAYFSYPWHYIERKKC